MPICAIHQKNRGEQNLDEVSPGVWQCRPDTMCKLAGEPSHADWNCQACGVLNFGSKSRCYFSCNPCPPADTLSSK